MIKLLKFRKNHVSMDIAALIEVCNTKYLPKVNFFDLEKKRIYKVTKIMMVLSSFSDVGQAVVLELNDSLHTFLPRRTSNILIEKKELYTDLEEKISKYTLYNLYIYNSEGGFKFKNIEQNVND